MQVCLFQQAQGTHTHTRLVQQQVTHTPTTFVPTWTGTKGAATRPVTVQGQVPGAGQGPGSWRGVHTVRSWCCIHAGSSVIVVFLVFFGVPEPVEVLGHHRQAGRQAVQQGPGWQARAHCVFVRVQAFRSSCATPAALFCVSCVCLMQELTQDTFKAPKGVRVSEVGWGGGRPHNGSALSRTVLQPCLLAAGCIPWDRNSITMPAFHEL